MKKLLAIVLVALMTVCLVACGKTEDKPADTTDKPDDQNTAAPVNADPLADEGHAIWCAHGNYLLVDGTANNWNGKDSELYEKSALKAISLEDVKAIDAALYETLSKKDVKYLYTIDLLLGTNDAGWNSKCMINGVKNNANGSYCFKVAQCTVDVDGDNKVYAEDQWISDPKTAHAESLTPATLFMPTWQEQPDENGFTWADNPVAIGGAGVYTLVIAQYNNASSPEQAGFGIALVLKEAKEGIAYEVVEEFVPTEHTYGIVGSFAGSNWGNDGADVEMTANGENTWTGEVELKAGDEFKVRCDNNWDVKDWGNAEGGNFVCEADGTYVVTITFEGGTGTVTVEAK